VDLLKLFMTAGSPYNDKEISNMNKKINYYHKSNVNMGSNTSNSIKTNEIDDKLRFA
jgi:hypothetical protein